MWRRHAHTVGGACGIRCAVWIAALFAASVVLSGCMTVTVENLTLMGGSTATITITAPKTTTVTSDTSIPAGALGL